MSNLYQRARSACAVLALLSTPLLSYAQLPGKEAANAAKVTPDLLFAQQTNGAPSNPNAAPDGLQRVVPYLVKDGRIAIEATATEGQDANALLQQLQGLGLTDGIAYDRLIFGFLPIDKIDDLKNVPNLQFARPSYKPMHNVGKVTTQGDKAQRTDVARQTYNVTGAGVKVGVISDSYNALGGAPAGVASGDLPANVQVIDDFPGGEDEGRAMAEIVHDVAPGADIAFNTAFKGQAGFAKGIRDLAAAGCKVITDDIYYFAEPFFQDGIISLAIRDVVTNKGVTYFTSAGNSKRQAYESSFRPATGVLTDQFSGALGNPHNFNPGGTADYFQRATIPAGGSITLVFQWDDRFFSINGAPGARTDMDLLIYVNGVLRPDLSSATNNIGGDPVEVTQIQNRFNTPANIDIVLVRYAGPAPTTVKWINENSSTLVYEYDTKSSTVTGHSNEKTAISVGAAYYRQTPAFNSNLTTAILEGFSSAGGSAILFDPSGNRLGAPEIRQKPEITGPDGGNTTFFIPGLDPDADGFPNFFGTSASAPHAAGLGALMVEKSANTISKDQLLTILEQTALDMDDPFTAGFDTGFDFGTGYGFIQADKALQQISGPVATAPFAITGVTTVSCETISVGQRRVTFTPQYTGLNGQPVTFQVVNETLPTTSPGPYTLNLYTDNPTIILKATQSGAPGEATFTYNWLAACNSTPTSTTTTPTPTPEPNPGVLTITGVTGVSCSAVSPTQRRLTLSPQYTGVNGQPITFEVVNETSPTTNAGPYSVLLYTDNPVIRLRATQAGTPGEATFTYNWLAACNNAGARQGAGERGTELSVRVLGNPVAGQLTVEVTGASGEPLTLQLMDMQGRLIEDRQVSQAGVTERHSFDLSRQSPGLLLLQANTTRQRQVSKVLKR